MYKSQKIKKIDIPTLYVGLSRVHKFSEHRVLPLSAYDKEILMNLQHDPLLTAFFNNYDNDGNWNYEGFKDYTPKRKKEAILDLGMIDSIESLIGDDGKYFAEILGVYVESKKVADYKKHLKKFHCEGQKLLQEQPQLVLERKIAWKKKLIKEDLSTMPVHRLRFFAKRLGIKNFKDQNTNDLKNYLQDIIKQVKILRNGSHISHTNINKNINNNKYVNNEMKIQNYDTHDVDQDIDLNYQQHSSNQHQNYYTPDVDEDEDIDLMVNHQDENYFTDDDDEMHALAAEMYS